MKLDRYNYEEYFILYLDNELSSEERREVEAFAAANPDLKAELDMLLHAKLSPDTDITFGNKEALLARDSSSISMNNYEEWLLCYIDKELTEQEAKHVEKFVAEHPAAKKDLELFQKTKLQPEVVVFPDKASLYHREEKVRVVAMRWWRIAAAAVLLIGISTTAVLVFNNKPGEEAGPRTSSIAQKDQPQMGQPATSSSITNPPVNDLPVNEEVMASAEKKDNRQPVKEEAARKHSNTFTVKKNIVSPGEKTEQPQPVTKEENIIANIDNGHKPTNNLPKPENNPNVSGSAIAGNNRDEIADKANPATTLTNPNSKTNTASVTPQSSETYKIQENASGQPKDNPDAVFASNDGKKNKLRGFFRKITRTIEKRANIKATDEEDDHLLIAGLAIKLN